MVGDDAAVLKVGHAPCDSRVAAGEASEVDISSCSSLRKADEMMKKKNTKGEGEKESCDRSDERSTSGVSRRYCSTAFTRPTTTRKSLVCSITQRLSKLSRDLDLASTAENDTQEENSMRYLALA